MVLILRRNECCLCGWNDPCVCSCKRLAIMCSLNHIICQTYLSWNIYVGSKGYWKKRLSKTVILNVLFSSMVYVSWASISFHSCLLNYANLEIFGSATCHFHVKELPSRTTSQIPGFLRLFTTFQNHAKNLFTYISLNAYMFCNHAYVIILI